MRARMLLSISTAPPTLRDENTMQIHWRRIGLEVASFILGVSFCVLLSILVDRFVSSGFLRWILNAAVLALALTLFGAITFVHKKAQTDENRG